MSDTDKIRKLQLEIQKMRQEEQSTIPVFHGDKILLVKLVRNTSAIYESELKGSVVAECLEADKAAYILDFIN